MTGEPTDECEAYEAIARRDAHGLKGHCYPAQEIREKWEAGEISGPVDEERIRTASWEPTLATEGYWIRMDTTGGFRPKKGVSVKESIEALPVRERRAIDLRTPYVLHPGQTYLFRFEQTVMLHHDEHVKASPKSSLGRCFVYVRLIADRHGSFDDIHGALSDGKPVALWVLVQPLTYHVILTPGLDLLQLRFFKGYDARLTDAEIASCWENGLPLLDVTEPIVMEGLLLRLDLRGKESGGVVGLRARPNPDPIDLAKKGQLDPFDYYDPIRPTNGRLVLRRGEHCLFVTRERLQCPSFLSMELSAHWGGGFAGPKHFAGFVDNGFSRNLVLEVRSDEIDDVELVDGMPIGKLDAYWTGMTDKPYGEAKSNYHAQVGPQPAKYFRPVDWKAQ